jgi:hypothetical protein
MFMAFITQRPVAPALLSHCNIDRTCSPTDDCIWAYRIMVHFADVLAFCYGKSDLSTPSPRSDIGTHRKMQWDELARYTQEWHECRPPHFHPTYSAAPAPGDIFPSIYYHLPIQVAAALYHHTSCILLAIHNPSLHQEPPPSCEAILRLRIAARTLHTLDTTVREHIRALCGIALCNPWLAPAMTMTSTALTMCGEHLCDVGRKEQEGMMELMVKNEEKHGWPTGAAQKYLRSVWGWDG